MGGDYGADEKAAITPWKNVKPGEDKMTGLVEPVGPERIRADGKAVTTPLENPELINPVE